MLSCTCVSGTSPPTPAKPGMLAHLASGTECSYRDMNSLKLRASSQHPLCLPKQLKNTFTKTDESLAVFNSTLRAPNESSRTSVKTQTADALLGGAGEEVSHMAPILIIQTDCSRSKLKIPLYLSKRIGLN